jgi:hypothetical protein
MPQNTQPNTSGTEAAQSQIDAEYGDANTPKQRNNIRVLVAIFVCVLLVAAIITFSLFNKPSTSTIEQVKPLAGAEQGLYFIDPNGRAYLSLNDAFPVSWKYDSSTFSGGVDLVLTSTGDEKECLVAENVDIADGHYQWVPRLTCPIVDGGSYSLVARSHRDKEILGKSQPFTGKDRHEVIEDFNPGERFVFDGTGISFEVPNGTKQILRSPVQSNGSSELSLFYGPGSISISVDNYFGEWNAGVDIKQIARSTIEVAGKSNSLMVYTSTVGMEDEQSEPFAVLFIDRDLDGENDVMIFSPYASNTDKATLDAFLASISIANQDI